MKIQSSDELAEEFAGLPGADLVLEGLRGLQLPGITENGLLVLIASPRLTRLGIYVPERNDIPRPCEHQLYALLEQTHGNDAHSRYNSLIRRIVSFSHALPGRSNHIL